MLQRLLNRVRLRYQYAVATGLLIVIVSGIIIGLSYRKLSRELSEEIDRQLFMAAILEERVPPGDEQFFDSLDGPGSISPEDYDRLIVAENNRLCRRLGLQYLWSCMQVGDEIVFTTSTSPSHDLTRGDHAKFWEVHSDPAAFDLVFGEERVDYSSFRNEWGYGRMALVPRRDAKGRKYCLGASISVNDVMLTLQRHLRNSLALSGTVLIIGVLFVIFVSTRLSRPLEELTDAAGSIAGGNLNRTVDIGGSSELLSLSESIERMTDSIREKITALEGEIRERIKAERELKDYRDRLEDIVRERTADLERSNKELEQFAYMASHDLKEPLRTVGSFVQILERKYKGKLDDEADKYISYAVDGVFRMQRLINDLLDYSRISTRAGDFGPVDCGKAVECALQDLTKAIEETSAQVSYDELPDVWGDQSQLCDLFQNLTANAIKFCDEAIPKINISAEKENEMWIFAVSDNGIGIEPEHADRIFSLFERLHKDKYQSGTGIGLAVCKRIVDRHGGEIWVESEPGRGSTFYFTIPGTEKGDQPAGQG